MHALFRHLAVRIWVTVAGGGILSFWLLPLLQGNFGLNWLVVEVLLILILCYLLTGLIFRHWGQSRITALIQDAAGYERDGLTSEALNCYERALAYLDSFLLSPRLQRSLSTPLARRLARFHIARADEAALSNFLPAYLMDQPEDLEVAEFWVRQAEQRGGFKETEQDLAGRISSAHPDNFDIQRVLAQFFIFLERTDYPALAAYRCIWNEPPPPADFVRELARLFVRDRRVDEWSLEAYLTAFRSGLARDVLVEALAACVHLIPETTATRQHLADARQVLTGLSDLDIEALSDEFRPRTPAEIRPKEHPLRPSRLQFLRQLPVQLAARVGIATRWLVDRLHAFLQVFRTSPRARRMVAIGFLISFVAGIGLFAWSTLRHLTKPPLPTAIETIQPPLPEVVDPYTLQVAAYLRLDYAKKYVAALKNQGLDAYWNEAVSGEKKWYQVRISHFPSKEAALQLGESLKSKGVIDDFYVANYTAANSN